MELQLHVPASTDGEYTLNPKFCPTLRRQGHAQGVPRCMQPYRNDRIITVIRDLFFSGGRASFATRYDALFTRHHGDSSVTREVPMAMVCLVATGVSFKIVMFLNSTLMSFF